jgi:hypothetical protein
MCYEGYAMLSHNKSTPLPKHHMKILHKSSHDSKDILTNSALITFTTVWYLIMSFTRATTLPIHFTEISVLSLIWNTNVSLPDETLFYSSMLELTCSCIFKNSLIHTHTQHMKWNTSSSAMGILTQMLITFSRADKIQLWIYSSLFELKLVGLLTFNVLHQLIGHLFCSRCATVIYKKTLVRSAPISCLTHHDGSKI